MNRLLVMLVLPLLCMGQGRKYNDAEADKIHRSLLLIDTHNDVTSETSRGLDIGNPGKTTHTDVARLKQGNVGAVFFAVYVAGSYTEGNRSAHRALEMIDTVRRDIVDRYPGDFELAASVEQIRAARKKGRIAALMGIEGGHAIEDSLRLLRTFFDLGIRYMTLTHSNHNGWADSSGPAEPRHNGLNELGRKVVAEMNRLGMMVDISHVSDKTFWDALETSRAPIFASHSSCRALSNIRRNMSDEMIRALAKKGGVVQVNFGCEFLSQKSADTSPVFRGGRPVTGEPPRDRPLQLRANLADIVAHIDHIVKIAGIDHAGIGSDFDGVRCVPDGLDDVSKFPNLTRALLEKGYSPADIGKIYGGNLLRVMSEAERVARQWPKN
jgi:membrane dipeptidase